MSPKGKQKRKAVPADVSRLLQIECGFRCSAVPCGTEWPTLQHHHIDGNPANSTFENILMLCPSHHAKVTAGEIDRKTCEMLKKIVGQVSALEPSPEIRSRNRLLNSLSYELLFNLTLLEEISPEPRRERGDRAFTPYPQLKRACLDQAIASGLFAGDLDRDLSGLLYAWSNAADRLNQGLALFDQWCLLRTERLEDLMRARSAMPTTALVEAVMKRWIDLMGHLRKHYSDHLYWLSEQSEEELPPDLELDLQMQRRVDRIRELVETAVSEGSEARAAPVADGEDSGEK